MNNQIPKIRIRHLPDFARVVACTVQSDIHLPVDEQGVYKQGPYRQGGAVVLFGDSGIGKTSAYKRMVASWRSHLEDLNPHSLADTAGIPTGTTAEYFYVGDRTVARSDVRRGDDGELVTIRGEAVRMVREHEWDFPGRGSLKRVARAAKESGRGLVCSVDDVTAAMLVQIQAAWLRNIQADQLAEVDLGRRVLWLMTANYATETPGHRPLSPAFMGRVAALEVQRPDDRDLTLYAMQAIRDSGAGGVEAYDIKADMDKVAAAWKDKWPDFLLRSIAVVSARPDLAFEDERKVDDLNAQMRKCEVIARQWCAASILGIDVMSANWDPDEKPDVGLLLAQAQIGVNKGASWAAEMRRGGGVQIGAVLRGESSYEPVPERPDVIYYFLVGGAGHIQGMAEGATKEHARKVYQLVVDKAVGMGKVSLVREPIRQLVASGDLNLRDLSEKARAAIRRVTLRE